MPAKVYQFGLIGHPLEHSLSPPLHNAALAAMGLQGSYHLYPVEPLPRGSWALAGLVDQVRSGDLDGLNVTIPHKQSVFPLVDELSPVARAAGAVNTLYLRDERLVGDNTDAPGFLSDLARLLPEEDRPGSQGGVHRTALILGAGGSARAVAYALASSGWRVRLAARRPEQAQALIAHLRPSLPEADLSALALEPSALEPCLEAISLVVNATPVGMWPDIQASPWPDRLRMPPGAVVYDLVYNPAQTAFVQAAWDAGLAAETGMGMLVEQAALALERWLGMHVPRDPMWAAVAGT